MAPNLTSGPTGVLSDPDVGCGTLSPPPVHQKKKEYKMELVWRNIILFIFLHTGAFYGLYLAFTSAKWYSIVMTFVFHLLSGLGITAGAHRLWAHRAYKVKTPLKLFLIFLQTIALQNSVYEWVRDHRVHHKFSETDADPHNANRGFFFAHIGWLCCKKHPDVQAKGKTVDMSDLKADPYIMFQKKYYIPLVLFHAFFFTTFIPIYFWRESFKNAFYVCTLLRYTITLHSTWLVNSAAHMWGNKPYDEHIGPTENVAVAFAASGEGWHNYHHVFPWDYKTAELGRYSHNMTTAFIDWWARNGWAFDLKTVPAEIIKKRVERTGDGSHPLWGWGDTDMTPEEKRIAEIQYKVAEKEY